MPVPRSASEITERTRRQLFALTAALFAAGQGMMLLSDLSAPTDHDVPSTVAGLVVSVLATVVLATPRINIPRLNIWLIGFIVLAAALELLHALSTPSIGERPCVTYILVAVSTFGLLPTKPAALITSLSFAAFAATLLSRPQHDAALLVYILCLSVFIGALSAHSLSINAKQKEADELQWLSRTDFLTGLHNRRSALSHLQTWQDAGRAYALLLLDIDYFKHINDGWGHDIGDQTLRAVAEHLQVQAGAHAEVARWGGEEFLLMLPAEREQQVEQWIRPFHRHEVKLHPDLPTVTFSGGAAFSNEQSFSGQSSFAQLLTLADQRLYQAKQGGRNQIRWREEAQPPPTSPPA